MSIWFYHSLLPTICGAMVAAVAVIPLRAFHSIASPHPAIHCYLWWLEVCSTVERYSCRCRLWSYEQLLVSLTGNVNDLRQNYLFGRRKEERKINAFFRLYSVVCEIWFSCESEPRCRAPHCTQICDETRNENHIGTTSLPCSAAFPSIWRWALELLLTCWMACLTWLVDFNKPVEYSE